MPMITSSGSVKSRLCPLPSPRKMGKFFHATLSLEDRSGFFFILKEPVIGKIKFKCRRWEEGKGMVSEETAYTVGIPWHLFGASVRFQSGICLGKAILFFFNEKPKDLKARPCSTVFSNMWTSGRICYGSSRPWYRSPIDRYIETLYRNFWMGGFNKDLAPATGSIPSDLVDSSGNSFSEWEHKAIPHFQEVYMKELFSSWERATKEGRKIRWKRIMDYASKPMNIPEAAQRALDWY